MMSKKLLALIGVATLGLSTSTLAQQGTQAGASSQTNVNAQANKKGAQASGSNSTSASAQTGRNSSTLDSGTEMNAVLSHPVDAKKNKQGDQVTAKTTDNVKSNGQVVIPKGSTLVGHVTQVQARGNAKSESSMGNVLETIFAGRSQSEFLPDIR